MKVVASYIEDQIITTNPEELEKIKKAKAEIKKAAVAQKPGPPPEIINRKPDSESGAMAAPKNNGGGASINALK
jgi:hypothetical protein